MSSNFIHTQIDSESCNMYRSVFFKRMDKSVGDTEDKSHIYIKLKPDAIDFSYFTRDTDDPMVVRRETAWFSLPLVSSEQTDNFLLNARQYELDIETTDTSFRLYYANRNTNFSNLETLKNEKHLSYIGIREVLLCLFHDLNSAESDLRRHTTADTIASILTRLNGSEVYGYIWKKFAFYKVLYDFETHYKHPDFRDELKVRYIEFLPKLLDEKIYDEIPVEHFHRKNWWLNPEEELDKLAEINKEHGINTDSLTQIQNYFLKKHAVLNALKVSAGNLFIPIIATSAIAGVLFLINWICWLNNIFKHTTLIWGAGTLLFVSSMVMLSTKRNFINMIMPRIFVAILSMLFVLIGAEELFTGMINVKTFGVVTTASISLFIISFFLFSESRQHSPAYKSSLHRMYDIKITPILFHAFNFANVLVLGLQLFIMPQLVDRSDYIKNDIFAENLREIEYTLKDCEDFSNKLLELDQYHNALLSIGNTKTSGSTSKVNPIDSTTTVLKMSLENNFPKEQQLLERNKEYIERLELGRYVYLGKYLDTVINKRFEPVKCKMDSVIGTILTSRYQHNKKQFTERDSVYIHIQAIILKGQILDNLRSDLVTFYRFMHQDSILNNLCTYPPNKKELTDSAMDNTAFNLFSTKYDLTYNPEKVIMIKPLKRDCFSYDISNPFGDNDGKDFILYPTLMMMQVCISLLFGIVGQLIISDKSVTEVL